MHPLLANQNSLYNIRVLALSLAAAQLFVEDCTGSDRWSLSNFVERLLYPFCWLKRTLTSLFSWLGCCCCCNSSRSGASSQSPTGTKGLGAPQPPSPPFNISSTQQPSGPIFGPGSGSGPIPQSSIGFLPPNTGDKIEISFLKDICRYIYQYQYDLVLLQEIKSEETFVLLCDIFRSTQLSYSHFYQCNNLTGSNSLFNLNWSGQASNNGMAVFSRWPLVSVKVEPADSLLTKGQLWHWPSWIWQPLVWFRTRFSTSSTTRTCPVNSSNAVQYVQININPSQPLTSLAKMNLPNRKYPTLTVHLFNVQLLNQSFVVLPSNPNGHSGGTGNSGSGSGGGGNWYRSNKTASPVLRQSSSTVGQIIASHANFNNRKMSEQQMLRLCQIFDLCKLVNTVEQICANNQNNVSYGLATGIGPSGSSVPSANTHQDIILIGGNFGHLDSGHHFSNSLIHSASSAMLLAGGSGTSIQSSFNSTTPFNTNSAINPGSPCLSVQDILQTFIPGLHNVYQSPDLIVSGDEWTQKLLKSKLFQLPKNEQLFIKYILYDGVSGGAISNSVNNQLPTTTTTNSTISLGSSGKLPPVSPSVATDSVPLSYQMDQQVYQCQIEFIHSKIKFNSYIQSMVNDYGWTVQDWKHNFYIKSKFNQRPLYSHPECKSRNIIDRYNNIIKSPVIEQPKGFNISIQLKKFTPPVVAARAQVPNTNTNQHHYNNQIHQFTNFNSNEEEESIKNHLIKSISLNRIPSVGKQPQQPQPQQQSQQPQQSALRKSGQIELHLHWCTLKRKIRVIQLFKIALRKYGQRLRTSQFRYSMLLYVTTLVILVCLSILINGSVMGFVAMVAILLCNLYLLFVVKNRQVSRLIHKLQQLIDQLNFELLVINSHSQSTSQDQPQNQMGDRPDMSNEWNGIGNSSQNNEWWIQYFVDKQKRKMALYAKKNAEQEQGPAGGGGAGPGQAQVAANGPNNAAGAEDPNNENNANNLNNNNGNENDGSEDAKKALDRFLGFKSQDTFGSGNFSFSQSHLTFRNSEISPISTTSF